MLPSLDIHLFGWDLHAASYQFFMEFAALSTLILGLLIATRRGLPFRPVLISLLAMAISLPIGARLLDVATKSDYYAREPERLFLVDFTGFSLFGGLLMASLVGVAVCRVLSLDLVRLADSVVPGLGVGIALMRVGCFLAGCCFGSVCNLPWAVTFPQGSEAHLYQLFRGGRLFGGSGAPLPVHPTQLYELTAALLGACIALWLLKRRAPEGSAFLFFAAWYSAFRLLNHFLRVPGTALTPIGNFYPVLYVLIVVVSLAALGWRLRASRDATGPSTAQSWLGQRP